MRPKDMYRYEARLRLRDNRGFTRCNCRTCWLPACVELGLYDGQPTRCTKAALESRPGAESRRQEKSRRELASLRAK